jgi:hypothetical protein
MAKFGKGKNGDTHRQGIKGGNERGKVRPSTDEERVTGQIERGEVVAGAEGAKKIAERTDRDGGTAGLGRGRKK